MPKRSRMPSDPNKLAARIVSETTGDAPKRKPKGRKKNPAAVALGRKGGKKGGKARARKLSKNPASRLGTGRHRILF